MIHIEILPLKNSLSHYYYYHHYSGVSRSDHAALAGLELTMQTKLASNSYRSAYSGSQVLGLNLSSFSRLIKYQSVILVSLCVQAQTTACLQRSQGNPGESVLSFHYGGDLGAKLKLSGLAQAPLKRLHLDVIHAGTNTASQATFPKDTVNSRFVYYSLLNPPASFSYT